MADWPIKHTTSVDRLRTRLNLLQQQGKMGGGDADTLGGQPPSAFALAGHGHAAADIVSGVLADARVGQSSVTQHQAALAVTESQITNLKDYWHPGNDGAGTGLDADKLDGKHAADFLQDESGTWTPVLIGAVTAGTHTYSAQAGQWHQRGALMFVDCDIQLTGKDAAMDGQVRISGLPEPATEDRSGIQIGRFGAGFAVPPDPLLKAKQIIGLIAGSEIRLEVVDNVFERGDYPSSSVGDAFAIRFSATYPVEFTALPES